MINKVKEMNLQYYLSEVLKIIKDAADPFKIKNLKGWTKKSLSQYPN
jgi:hypothetical protein